MAHFFKSRFSKRIEQVHRKAVGLLEKAQNGTEVTQVLVTDFSATVFEKPVGNPAQINDHGQRALDNILNHPEKKLVQYTHEIHGPVIEIEAPEIGGVRFTGDGKEMMGFLEPKWFKK